MKKFLAVLLAMALLTLCACGSGNENSGTPEDQDDQGVSQEQGTQAVSKAQDESEGLPGSDKLSVPDASDGQDKKDEDSIDSGGSAVVTDPSQASDDPNTSGEPEGNNQPDEPDDPEIPGGSSEPEPSEEHNAEDPAAVTLASSPLTDIRAAITEGVPDIDESYSDRMLDEATYQQMLVDYGITEEDYPFSDWFAFDTFIPYVDGYEALLYEPDIFTVAFSLVVMRVPDGTDTKAVAAEMKEQANPYKWGCVDAEIIESYYKDNVIILIMLEGNDDDSARIKHDIMRDNFLALS